MEDTNVKTEAVALVRKHFGDTTASLYEESFRIQPEKTVLLIIRELLTEYLGEDQAKSQMGEKLNKLYDEYASQK